METEELSKEALDMHNEILSTENRREGSAKASSAANTTASHMALAQKLKGKSEKGDGSVASQGSKPGGGGGIGALMMMKRKLTKWKMGRSSGWSTGSKDKTPAKLENTFRLEPQDTGKFNNQKVRDAIEEVVLFYMANTKEYHAQKCSQTSRYIAEEIKSKIKQLGFNRYKIVTNVVIGQDKDQGMEVASRCIWDTNNDDMAHYTYRKNDLYLLVLVYGVYFE